ncbi:hypothetical protein Tco_0512408 [Tanacetum coccineum]
MWRASRTPASVLLLGSVAGSWCLGFRVVAILPLFILIPTLHHKIRCVFTALSLAFCSFFFLHLFGRCTARVVIIYVTHFSKKLIRHRFPKDPGEPFLPPVILTADVDVCEFVLSVHRMSMMNYQELDGNYMVCFPFMFININFPATQKTVEGTSMKD